MGFEKFNIFARNRKVLAYGFSENCQFGAKTDRITVFLGCDPRITNQLSIMVPYFNFYGFWKISHFCSKSKGVSLQFYRKLSVWGKNWSKLCISLSWPRIVNWLSIAVPYFNFYGSWKISHFCSKPKGVSLQFYRKLSVWGKNWSKLCSSVSWPPYCESVIYNGPVFQFLRVLKNLTFFLEIQRC
jgi:hypothetical protein